MQQIKTNQLINELFTERHIDYQQRIEKTLTLAQYNEIKTLITNVQQNGETFHNHHINAIDAANVANNHCTIYFEPNHIDAYILYDGTPRANINIDYSFAIFKQYDENNNIEYKFMVWDY